MGLDDHALVLVQHEGAMGDTFDYFRCIGAKVSLPKCKSFGTDHQLRAGHMRVGAREHTHTLARRGLCNREAPPTLTATRIVETISIEYKV